MASIPATFRLTGSKTLYFLTLTLCFSPFPAGGFAQQSALSEDEAIFQDLSQLHRAAADRTAVIDAFTKFLKMYPRSPRAPDAQFMRGEVYMANGLELKLAEKSDKTTPAAGAGSPAAAA